MINKLKFALSFLAMALSLSINATITSGTCGESATFRLEDDGTLYIEGSGEMRNYPNSTFLTQEKEVKVIKILEGVTSIGERAFYGCSSLSSITIPNSVTSIGESAFSGCSSLASITIPNSVTSIGYKAFSGCSSLPVENDIRYADTYLIEVTNMENSTYKIKEGTRFIGSSAFSWHSSLSSITIPNSVTSIGNNAFYRCSSLSSITIPNSVTSIGKSAFSGCSSLASITIPNSVTSIGGGAFSSCSSLSSITIPNSVTSIGESAFSGCSSLTNIHIDDITSWIKTEGVGNLTGNMKHLFVNGEEITSITIASDVEKIGKGTFSGLPIRCVISKAAKVPEIDGSIFSAQTYYHAPLYVPSDSYYDYAFDKYWYEFINIKKYVDDSDLIDESKAYMLLNEAKTRYIVYDNVNDKLNTIDISDMDESNPYNSWMVLNVDGAPQYYNLGAKKYAVRSNNGTGLEMGERVQTVNEAKARYANLADNILYVENGSISIDNDLKNEALAIGSLQMDENMSGMYSISGTRLSSPRKGINIIRMNDGTTRKVYVK
ncbi:MAG: leucine-rich repeat domain-containing protein [Bacteroidaceae bacterium]|nr:leucine-rich repeat domain-containing protein [Bacteroidaceae bacterium]